jgi:ABC-type sugar transport system ATPase subunit
VASLSIENLRKTFGADTVVDDVGIEVADGEFVVLVGPSGCGKSTTLRMIAGLEGIDGGSIRIGDRVVNALHPADRDVAMVFQSYALYPHMSVRDNISYGLKRRGLPRAEIESRVNAVAAMLKLEALLGRRPAQLSGGQRQRVALGRAIVPSFSWMSPSPTSMPSCASRCAGNSRACTTSLASPPFTLPMTRSRP